MGKTLDRLGTPMGSARHLILKEKVVQETRRVFSLLDRRIEQRPRLVLLHIGDKFPNHLFAPHRTSKVSLSLTIVVWQWYA